MKKIYFYVDQTIVLVLSELKSRLSGSIFRLIYSFSKVQIALIRWLSGVNLINIQRLVLRLRLKKASTGIYRGLMLTVIFESYKHELEAY